MDLKKEFEEYREIYNKYFDAITKEQNAATEKKKEIIEKDKEDLQLSIDSKEKHEMLEEYMLFAYRISLISSDMAKISQRLLYLNETSVRKGIDLELSEEDKGFIRGISDTHKTTYVIDSNGNLASKTKDLEEIIKSRLKERKDMTYAYLEEIRKSEANE